MLRIYFLTFFFILITGLSAQDIMTEQERLYYFADVMNNASVARHRNIANDSFNVLFLKSLSKKESFQEPFDSLKWISKHEAKDQSFRIFTWILDQGNGQFVHHGVLQNQQGKVWNLRDNLKALDDWEFSISGTDDWMGAMYYQMIERTENGNSYYILFGLHRYDQLENVKIADVLSFDKNGNPSFGKEIFFRDYKDSRDVVKTRIVLKYKSSSYVGLHYNEGMDMIVHDYLIPDMMSPSPGNMTMVSDGSLVGYELKKGKWSYIDKIYTQVLDEAPRPQPVLDERAPKDIFGRTQKEKK